MSILDELNRLEVAVSIHLTIVPPVASFHHQLLPTTWIFPQPCKTVRCRDCFWRRAVVHTMLCADHAHNPLHIIRYIVLLFILCGPLTSFLQKWNGSYFEPTTLADIGLCIQLGHPPENPFSTPLQYDEFTVIPYNGPTMSMLITANCDHFADYGSHLQNSFGGSGILLHTTSLKPVQCSQCSNTFTCKISGQGRWLRLLLSTGELTDNAGMSKIK